MPYSKEGWAKHTVVTRELIEEKKLQTCGVLATFLLLFLVQKPGREKQVWKKVDLAALLKSVVL